MKKHVITIDSQNYRIKDGYVIFSIRPSEPIKIRLASYVMEQLSEFKPTEMIITPNKLIFACTKDVTERIPERYIGIDRSLAIMQQDNLAEQGFSGMQAEQYPARFRSAGGHSAGIGVWGKCLVI